MVFKRSCICKKKKFFLFLLCKKKNFFFKEFRTKHSIYFAHISKLLKMNSSPPGLQRTFSVIQQPPLEPNELSAQTPLLKRTKSVVPSSLQQHGSSSKYKKRRTPDNKKPSLETLVEEKKFDYNKALDELVLRITNSDDPVSDNLLRLLAEVLDAHACQVENGGNSSTATEEPTKWGEMLALSVQELVLTFKKNWSYVRKK